MGSGGALTLLWGCVGLSLKFALKNDFDGFHNLAPTCQRAVIFWLVCSEMGS